MRPLPGEKAQGTSLFCPSSGFNGSSIKLMSAPRPVRWIGEGYGSPLPTHQSFEIAAFKGITAQDAMATEKP